MKKEEGQGFFLAASSFLKFICDSITPISPECKRKLWSRMPKYEETVTGLLWILPPLCEKRENPEGKTAFLMEYDGCDFRKCRIFINDIQKYCSAMGKYGRYSLKKEKIKTKWTNVRNFSACKNAENGVE